MQRIIREVSEKRQAAIDFALGPALGAVSIAIGSRIVLDADGYSNRLNLWIMMIGRSTANKTAPMKDICAMPPRVSTERTPVKCRGNRRRGHCRE